MLFTYVKCLISTTTCNLYFDHSFYIATFVKLMFTIMNERLQKFLDAENISQAFFADTIGVARASVSHILSGRNKPGYDFINSMLVHYPRLNIEWLLSGKGKMYKDISSEKDNRNCDAEYSDLSLFGDSKSPEEGAFTNMQEASSNIETSEKRPRDILAENKRRIERIVIFYDDNTFEEIS